MPANIGYAAPAAHSPLAPMGFARPAVGPGDVRIEITFCGVCHSDDIADNDVACRYVIDNSTLPQPGN